MLLPHQYAINAKGSTKIERTKLADYLVVKDYKLLNRTDFIESPKDYYLHNGTEWIRTSDARNKTIITISAFLDQVFPKTSLLEILTNSIYYTEITTKELGSIVLFPTGIYIKTSNIFIPHQEQKGLL